MRVLLAQFILFGITQLGITHEKKGDFRSIKGSRFNRCDGSSGDSEGMHGDVAFFRAGVDAEGPVDAVVLGLLDDVCAPAGDAGRDEEWRVEVQREVEEEVGERGILRKECERFTYTGADHRGHTAAILAQGVTGRTAGASDLWVRSGGPSEEAADSSR